MAKYSYITEINPIPYGELTDMEKYRLEKLWIINGFWGASQSWIARWLIGIIMNDFDTAIPDYHDYGYYIGGDESRRKEYDEKFYQAMLDDIRSLYDEWEIGKWELLWKSIIANLAYYAIRWKGSKYFNYSE